MQRHILTQDTIKEGSPRDSMTASRTTIPIPTQNQNIYMDSKKALDEVLQITQQKQPPTVKQIVPSSLS